MNGEHGYAIELEWLGNRGTGTSGYRDYGREHVVRAEGKHDIEASADRTFHGDRDRWNPEELLLAALTQCHLLSYLHVASSRGVVVVEYRDSATATLVLNSQGGGRMSRALLRPVVTVSDESMAAEAMAAHHEASEKCFIAASVNFPVEHEPRILTVTAR